VKVDFKKSCDTYRARGGEFRVVDVPPMQYLMVDKQARLRTILRQPVREA
jgi:hypothetical protein